ncbi:MAG: integrase core domain-containing protein [bacterium]
MRSLAFEEVLTAPRSPWQNPYAGRLIGSIRRECLNHVIVYNDRHLKRLLRSCFAHYYTARTHLPLDKQCPQPRLSERQERGKIIAFPHVGGLHHEYRRAA